MKSENLDIDKINDVFDSMITTTELTRGKAPQIINEVTEKGGVYFVTKNTKPVAVILSYKDYIEICKNNKK